MLICAVIDKLVSDVAHAAYRGKKLLLVKPHTADGQARPLVAIDYLGAGVGDTVLVSTSPGLAESVFPGQKLPADALIIGLIDPTP
jgi:ethanolamine utilization protein EutN